MPIVQRAKLRQTLGRAYLRDTLVSTATVQCAANATVFVLDDTTRDGQFFTDQMYARAWVKTSGFQFRVATWNTYSGAFVGVNLAPTTVGVGAEYEVHNLIAPNEKDIALDEAIKAIRFRQEVAIGGVSGMAIYSLPDYVDEVYHVKYADATGTARDFHNLDGWGLSMTATGRELRISPCIDASHQLVLDALVEVTLGAADTATGWFPNEDLILTGAAARCYWMLEQRAPGQEATLYRTRRAELQRRFNMLVHAYRPSINRDIALED